MYQRLFRPRSRASSSPSPSFARRDSSSSFHNNTKIRMRSRGGDVEEGVTSAETASTSEASPLTLPLMDRKSSEDEQEEFSSSTAASTSSSSSPALARQQAWRLCFGAAGITGAYLVYGHCQEDLFRYRADDGSRFEFAWFLQVLECVVNILLGLVMVLWAGKTQLPNNLLLFGTSGATQVVAKALTSHALAAGLSFPVVTLSKSAKIVPVMLGQLAIGGSRYSLRDYGMAAVLVAGTALLSLEKNGSGGKDKQEHAEEDDAMISSNTATGLSLILASLVMDGLTAGLQKRLKSHTPVGKQPSSYDFLLYSNIAMALVAAIMGQATGDIARGWSFLVQNPTTWQMVASVCLCSAIGQSFIFYVIAQFDPLVCSTITTVRKILSVLWSLATKGHSVSDQGRLGLCLAVSALILEVQGKVSRAQQASSKSKRLRTSSSSSSE